MQLHHVELYSGIGGMRIAVQAALPASVQYVCHKAFDVNANANSVYEHNFGHKPTLLSLEHCTAADLHVRQQQQQQQVSSKRPPPLLWTLSPPCQPYTTTAHSKQADAQDARASSLAHLLQLMRQLEQLPSHILLENVASFHASQSHQQLRAVLGQLDYHVVDVALCPSQLGIPHLRRRHYTLAIRRRQQQQQQQGKEPEQKHEQQQEQTHASNNSSGTTAGSSGDALTLSEATTAQLQLLAHGKPPIRLAAAACHPHNLRSYLDLDWSQHTQPLRECSVAVQQQVSRYALPLSRVGRYFKVLDLVAPGISSHSNCFTKGYGKNILGTGSYLLEDAAAHLLARQDSRGRWHLEDDPYSSSNTCSSAAQTVSQKHAAALCSANGSGSSSVEAATRTRQSSCSCLPSAQQNVHCIQQFGLGAAIMTPTQQAPAGAGCSQVDEGEVPPMLRVRCFTPREVANLQGFPASFSFPEAITDRQAYALLGNSVSINAVSYLVRLLLHDVLGGT